MLARSEKEEQGKHRFIKTQWPSEREERKRELTMEMGQWQHE